MPRKNGPGESEPEQEEEFFLPHLLNIGRSGVGEPQKKISGGKEKLLYVEREYTQRSSCGEGYRG